MAGDNVILNEGAGGETVASDEIGGVQHQRMKIQYGVDGAATDVSAATPLPVLDPMLELARGNITGQSHVNKFGGSPEVASGVQEDIWDGQGTYSFPITADMTHIKQSVDDATMRGETIEVYGLDTNWALVTQTKALDGSNTTTAVALDTAMKRVFRMKVLADVVAAQDVVCVNVGGGTTYAKILAGNNQTLMAIYTVPAGKTGFLDEYYGDVIPTATKNPTATEFRLWFADRHNGYEFQLKHERGATSTKIDVGWAFKVPLVVTQKTDIKISAQPNDKAAKVFAGFDLRLVDD